MHQMDNKEKNKVLVRQYRDGDTCAFDELIEIKQTAIQKALIRCLPIDAVKIDEVVDKIKAMLGKTYKPSDLIEELEQMVDNNTISKKNGVLGNKYFES